MTREVPLPDNVSWVVVGQSNGLQLAFEWRRGFRAPRWSDYPILYRWMVAQTYSAYDTVIDRAFCASELKGDGGVWLLFTCPDHDLWSTDPRDATN